MTNKESRDNDVNVTKTRPNHDNWICKLLVNFQTHSDAWCGLFILCLFLKMVLFDRLNPIQLYLLSTFKHPKCCTEKKAHNYIQQK